MEVELPETIEECHRLIRHLLEVIDELRAEVRQLKAQLNQNSQNSSRPPSKDGFNQPKPAFGKPKKRRKGGQKGHRGNTLKKVETPDLTIDCEPLKCDCRRPEWTEKVEIIEARQVFEVPQPRLEVIEYRRLKRTCRCGKSVCGEFPESVAATVQYGMRVQAMVALLSVHGCLSYGKIGQLFADLYGYQLNTATAQKMVNQTSEMMPLEAIRAGIISSEVVHFDETGIKENGVRKWLHTASTEKLTYQFADVKRGNEAMKSEKSVLPEFKGVAVHDCWGSYFGFDEMTHATCNAHILRELTGIIENDSSKWAASMKRLLRKMYVESDYGKGIIRDVGKYEKSYERILRKGEKEEPPPKKTREKGRLKRTKGRNLLERLRKYQEAVLRFAREEKVPFTNNIAERDIRPTKIKQKVSGGFRSQIGSESYCRIQSFISSMRKQSRQVFEELLAAIRGERFEIYQTC